MKWKNKRHELEEFATNLPEKFRDKIYVFGAGELGKVTGLCLEKLGLLGGFIDNDTRKQGMVLCGKTILSLKEYLSCNEDVAIVISASQRIAREIEQQLMQEKLMYKKDYYVHDEFHDRILPIITAYYFNRTYMRLAQITLTERCTLRCKKCAHACYNVDSLSKDMSLSDVYKSADSFFAKVDFINEFVLIGGEPLLYQQLANAIDYVGEHYRKKMVIFSITTNGTIVPSKEVLEASRNYRVLYRISNYSASLPRLREAHRRLLSTLEEYGIEYKLSPESGNWIDYGFDYLNKSMDEDELIKTFDHCLTPCREVRGNKLYFCVMARSVSDNLRLGEGREDYLDLERLDGPDYQKELMEFNLGYSEKGYLDMCHRCHGMNAEKYPIPIAEQITHN